MLAPCPACGELVRFSVGDSGEPYFDPLLMCPECGATFEQEEIDDSENEYPNEEEM